MVAVSVLRYLLQVPEVEVLVSGHHVHQLLGVETVEHSSSGHVQEALGNTVILHMGRGEGDCRKGTRVASNISLADCRYKGCF